MHIPGRQVTAFPFMNRSAKQVFLSYARSVSSESARALQEALGSDRTFLDVNREDIPLGEPFPKRIADAMLASQVVVVFASDTYFDRWYCWKEWQMALSPYRIRLARGERGRDCDQELEPLVVVLPSGAAPDFHSRLPPKIQTLNLACSEDVEEVRQAVEGVLQRTSGRDQHGPSLQERLSRLHALEEVRDSLAGVEPIPPPREPRGRVYPLSLPLSLRERFVGRARLMQQLHDALLPGGEPSGTSASLTGALTGGGGFGKSQLALEYLWRFQSPYYPGGVFWLDTEVSEDQLEQQWLDILRVFRPAALPTIQEMRRAGRSVRSELEQALHGDEKGSKLFVLDNVPESLKNQPPKSLDDLLPGRAWVTVLATSRRSIGDAGAGLAVDVLEKDPARELLTSQVPNGNSLSAEEWDRITEWVGHLPLALTLLHQALQHGLDPSQLLSYADGRSTVDVLDRECDALRDSIPEEHLRGITEALAVSYERLPEETRVAARVCSILAPEPIPAKLLTEICGDLGGRQSEVRLVGRSFLFHARGSAHWTMHRVLADFLRERGEVRDDWSRAMDALQRIIEPERFAETEARRLSLDCVAAAGRAMERTPEPLETSGARRLSDLARRLTDLGQTAGDGVSLEVATTAYRKALEEYTQERVPQDWARTQNNLGIVLKVRGELEGDVLSLQEAECAYRKALEEFTQKRTPQQWAMTQNNWGLVLQVRGQLEGDVQALQAAECAYRKALEERTQERTPLDWARAQNNLGIVLKVRGQHEGDVEALREAESAFRQALEEYTQERTPQEWATTQNNMGAVLQARGQLEGDVEALQEAESAYRKALEERTQGGTPQGWAMTQNNLGIVLQVRGQQEGDVQALREAESAYQKALEEHTQERTPQDWARTQNNLGIVLKVRGQLEGDVQALQEAECAFRKALEEYTQERTPQQWAMTQNNLGIVLKVRGQLEGDAQALQEAESAYRKALEERTQEGTPQGWAMTQNNLGVVLKVLGQLEGDVQALREAESAFRQALEEYTQERTPQHWAATQNNLGTVLKVRGQLDGDVQALQEAECAYRKALEEFTQERTPQDWARTQNNLRKVVALLKALKAPSGGEDSAN